MCVKRKCEEDMRYTVTDSHVFPLVEVSLDRGEQILLERGAMVYHNGLVSIEGKMNSNGAGGLGGVVKALGRSMVSGESMFITTATGTENGGKIGIAPGTPGIIRALDIGAEHWRLNDSAFFACDTTVSYAMKRQSVGKAMFGKTGGLFVMETQGNGTMLVSTYGDVIELDLDGSRSITVDNTHVVAWTSSLDYDIKAGSGIFGFKTGEGLVNEFRGRGKVLVQTRNVEALAGILSPYIASGS